MTDEQWAKVKVGDLLWRGGDGEIVEVLNINKAKRGKPAGLDVRQITPPPSYTATEPKAYEVFDEKG